MVAYSRFPMSELSRRSGVPPATIHHYLRRGLLPQPHRVAANRFLYEERHVRALKVIRLLRERRGLPLAVIGDLLPEFLGSDEEAFRSDMWERALGRHLGEANQRPPDARLLDAAIELFSRHGHGEVNVDAICRAAGIAKGSFYRHYRSKEELFFAAAEAAVVQVAESIADVALDGDEADEEQAAAALATALAPRLPLILDLAAGTFQRRPGYRDVAVRLTVALIGRLRDGLAPRRGEFNTVGRVVERALLRIVQSVVLQPEPTGSGVSDLPGRRGA